MKDVILGQKK